MRHLHGLRVGWEFGWEFGGFDWRCDIDWFSGFSGFSSMPNYAPAQEDEEDDEGYSADGDSDDSAYWKVRALGVGRRRWGGSASISGDSSSIICCISGARRDA